MIALGIDTSCYTTSAALVSEEGALLSQARRLLPVKEGARGLMQSEALFQHVKALPELVRIINGNTETDLTAGNVVFYIRELLSLPGDGVRFAPVSAGESSSPNGLQEPPTHRR